MTEESFSWDNSYKSGDYRKHWHYSNPSQELATFLASIELRKGKALDIGCGAGVETMYLAENGFQTYGLDISGKAIKIAKALAEKRKLRSDFRVGTVLNMPYPNASFDLLNDRGCLHNLNLDDWSRYAAETAKVARPGAYFLLRGASNKEPHDQFTYLSQKRLDKYFGKYYDIGVPREYRMASDAGTLESLVAMLKRRFTRSRTVRPS